MIGPKLDARSYTNLVLVVISVLLALNLMAQLPGNKTASALYTPEAEAMGQIAASIKEVAVANQQIAQSLQQLSDSVKNAGTAMATVAQQGSGAASSAPAASSPVEPAPAAAPAIPAGPGQKKGPVYEGKIEIK